MSRKKIRKVMSEKDTNEIIEEKTENDNEKKIYMEKSTNIGNENKKNEIYKDEERPRIEEFKDSKINLKRMKMLELLADSDSDSDSEEYRMKEIKSMLKKTTRIIKNNKTQKTSRKSSELSKEIKVKSETTGTVIGRKISKISDEIKKTVSKSNFNLKKSQKNGGTKNMFQKNKKIIYIGLSILIIAIAGYGAYYSKMPSLKETHNPDIKGVIASYDGDLHPFEILSSNRERMAAFKGEPVSKGDGKTEATKFVIYKLDWFGNNRETIMFYDKENHFTRIKLNIGNESAKKLVEKLTENFGSPVEDKDSTAKGGYGIWIKDSVQYKLVHHGNYATIEMKLARYDNSNKLDVGKYPIAIQKLYKLDLNKDDKQESVILLGNKTNSLSTNYDKLYLLMWDGKTHLAKMEKNFDGGTYPQVEFKDMDKDGKDEIVIYSENNEVVRNYNIFKYDGAKLQLTYSGHEEPQKKN